MYNFFFVRFIFQFKYVVVVAALVDVCYSHVGNKSVLFSITLYNVCVCVSCGGNKISIQGGRMFRVGQIYFVFFIISISYTFLMSSSYILSIVCEKFMGRYSN